MLTKLKINGRQVRIKCPANALVNALSSPTIREVHFAAPVTHAAGPAHASSDHTCVYRDAAQHLVWLIIRNFK